VDQPRGPSLASKSLQGTKGTARTPPRPLPQQAAARSTAGQHVQRRVIPSPELPPDPPPGSGWSPDSPWFGFFSIPAEALEEFLRVARVPAPPPPPAAKRQSAAPPQPAEDARPAGGRSRLPPWRKKCEDCGLKQPGYGLAAEGKTRWCADCGRAKGAVLLQKQKMCEGCGLKQPNFGLASEGKRRWCVDCGEAKGAVGIQALQRRQRTREPAV
jgi:hypothetical protein